MSRKPKVIVFIDWFYPAHKAGGPIRSVYNTVMALSQEVDFYIVTSAYDIGEVKPLVGIETGIWLQKENYSIIYLEKETQTRKKYKSLIKEIEPQTIYLNSLFSVGFTLKPLLANTNKIRTVLAPRGMLKKEALAIKPLKKRVFLSLMRSTRLMNSITWHASSDIEADEVCLHFGAKSEVVIAQNMAVSMPERSVSTISKASGELRLIFVSRINAIKNLDFLLEVISKIKNPMITLDIFGPIEEEDYWQYCTKMIQQKELNVSYKGILGQYEKEKVLWNYDYLVLPTKGENYGHVIVESLLASLPVVISQETPWVNLEEHQAGFDLPLTINAFVNCLNRLIIQDLESYTNYVNGARAFSNKFIVNSKVFLDNKKLFLND
jgi:glycosyltransferase involved in cell wall biosynthesis